MDLSLLERIFSVLFQRLQFALQVTVYTRVELQKVLWDLSVTTNTTIEVTGLWRLKLQSLRGKIFWTMETDRSTTGIPKAIDWTLMQIATNVVVQTKDVLNHVPS